ncbi:hypothetical protein, partial [uncultured Lamprocystis sp.]|uniref:hypothetical protein n=1 Tax=uncultured Lamprocystis sp. TaxID=543132 RepID=UPI0025E38AF3
VSVVAGPGCWTRTFGGQVWRHRAGCEVPSMALGSGILAGTTGCEIRGGRRGGAAAAALG